MRKSKITPTTPLEMHELIDIVITVLDARDPYTFEHSWRVAHFSEIIALRMGLDPPWVDLIHLAAHLHDIGKVGVPDYILNKAGRLSEAEYAQMKTHPRIGYNIVKKLPALEEMAHYILAHHERWDGGGYPQGLAGKEIPLGARIIAVADSFDAMTSDRAYRSKLSVNQAFGQIALGAGGQFCPETAEAFLGLQREMPELLASVNQEIIHAAFQQEENSLMVRRALGGGATL